MIDGTTTYQYPNGSKAPTQLQMLTTNSVNAQVSLAAGGSEADVIHNFQFDQSLPASDLQTPMVTVNALTPGAAMPAVSHPDGNTLNLSNTNQTSTAAVYDVWITRQIGAKPFTPPAAAPKA
jgi:hypothetical protein